MAKTEVTFTGSFSIHVSEDLLVATLNFDQSGPESKSWKLQDISQFLQSNNVLAFTPEDLNRALTPFYQKAEKRFQAVVAKGFAPLAAVPEQVQLEQLPIPESWKTAVEETIKQSPPPVIVKETQVKVEREKTVVKKAPLPFLPGKEETVKVVEKETHTEAVPIDPKVLQTAYIAQAGKRIGVIFASKVGKPGNTVGGKPIPAPVLEDSNFYPGEHVNRKGSELTSLTAGIVRVGYNWADIVPFTDHQWSLSQSDDKVTCYLSFTPGNPGLPPPAFQTIADAAVKQGIKADSLLAGNEIEAWIRNAIEKQEPFERKSISQTEDASFEIVVSEDKLSAVLNVNKGGGQGKALVLKELGKVLNESKLVMDKEKVKKDILAFYNSPERSLSGYFLTEGTPPAEPPAQAPLWDIDALTGKKIDEAKAKIAPALRADTAMASFPMDGLKQIALVEKEDRPITLTPITSGPSGKDVYGTQIPGVQTKALEVQVYGGLEKLGPSIFSAKEKGMFLHAEKDGKLYVALIPYADGELEVEVSPDDMKAQLFARPHIGLGTQIKKETILAGLEKAGVKKGIDETILATVLEGLEQGKTFEHLQIAIGQAPVPGGASEVKWHIEFASGQNLRVRQDGTVDYRNQDHFTTVAKDTLLAEIMPPDHAPTPGWNVKGAVLNAPDVAGPPLQFGSNLRQESGENGKILVFSTVDGEVKNENGKLDVVAAYTIKGNIDTTSGNIKFPGTVQVTGDVLSGFAIVSGGEIKVGGSVEASLLNAESNIVINGGVKGAGKALLRSKAGIQAGFIELCTVMAIGEIRVKKALIRSRLKGNARLVMADDAQIYGGELRLKQGVSAGNIGNEKGVPTKIFFGQDVLVEDLIAVEEKEIKKIQEELAIIDTTMKKSEKVMDRPAMQDLFNRKVGLMKALEKRNLRLFTLKERFEQHFESDIVVKGTLWPGVVIESHGRTHEVSKPTKAVRIYFDTAAGRIVETPIGST